MCVCVCVCVCKFEPQFEMPLKLIYQINMKSYFYFCFG